MNVTRKTRTGIAYQWSGRGFGGMILGYTINRPPAFVRTVDLDLDLRFLQRNGAPSGL